MSAIIEIESSGIALAEEYILEAQKLRIVKIKSNEGYSSAGINLKNIKELQKKVEEAFDPIIENTRKSWKKSLEQKAKYLNPLMEIEKMVKNAMVSYQNEQEKIRLEAQKKAEAEAKAKEETERKRIEAKAAKAEEKGNTEKAEELRQQAEELHVPVPIIQKETPKLDGVSTKIIWKFQIVDEKLIPREYLKIDEVALGAVVRATKGANKIPGVRIYPEKSIAA